ncbi:glutaredoxin-related protein 5, mitochondrial [Orussus abietinus]|uniref:glutaredoxin-related protein 5, mitochondrial n=1 Tax=Orussus abietinus TaxID=222816 RepID=UPI0006253E49|nr:glutaredoxin-related protein 5, mitochondrial [Orussus abietinus]XP_012284966.1 glutaredoxin-related protein 5, mitochondrial [Orussus abietinus]
MLALKIARRVLSVRNFATSPEEIGKLVKKSKVVVFMKGVPEQPKCGFSNAVVQILRMHGVTYEAHDVLQDEELRQGIKEFSNWPTIPQVFIDGDFVGGCDILLQMHQNGDLVNELKKAGISSALLEKTEASSEAATKKSTK